MAQNHEQQVTVTRKELAQPYWYVIASFVYGPDNWKQLAIKVDIPQHPAHGEGSLVYIVSQPGDVYQEFHDFDNAIGEYNKT